MAILLPCLAWLAGCGGETPAPEPAKERRPSVLLIFVDTLRADRLGSYGYALDTSPVLDGLAAKGVRFTDVTAQWPRTWPSMASFMAGEYPRTTGLRLKRRVAPESLTMISEVFRAAGYHTGAVVANWNVGRATGFAQGFDEFAEVWADKLKEGVPGRGLGTMSAEEAKRNIDATLVNDKALQWLGSVPRGEPWFLWLHYMETHGPYLPPPEYAGLFEGAHPRQPVRPGAFERYQLQIDPATGDPILDIGFYKAQYDREVRHVDTQIGLLLEALSKTRPGEDLLILFTADHGESLDEHGYYLDHGRYSYQVTARVPAILVREGGLPAGRTVDAPVGLIDLSRTLVELAGLSPPASFEGTSLLPLLEGEDGEGGGRFEAGPSHVFMESGDNEAAPQRTVRRGTWKLIDVAWPRDRAGMKGSRFELYDLSEDPDERRNLAAARPEIVEALSAAIDAWSRGAPVVSPAKEIDMDAIDEKTREMLRTLGYVE